MSNPSKNFIIHTLRLFASIKGRINFLQLGRFSKFCEQYFRIGFRKQFDFLFFNTRLLKEHLASCLAIALDSSCISKSGKLTPGTGHFCFGFASKIKWGLELCGFSVAGITANTAYHLKAYQSPSTQELKQQDSGLLPHYGKLVKEQAGQWLCFSIYLSADAYFSKTGHRPSHSLRNASYLPPER